MTPQQGIVKFFSPAKDDQGLIELHDTTTASYQALDAGQPHPNTRDYPGFKLGRQFNIPNDHKWLVRVYVKDSTNPLWFNYAIKYLGESTAHPIFVRQYRLPRKTYSPATKGSALDSVYQIKLATAGSGYTVGTFPAVTASGGGGSGMTGYGVVAPDGTIAEFVLTSGGTGYTSAPTLTVEDPESGTTATATALVQPTTALLVIEEAQEYPQDSEFFGLYLNVVRVYQTLPGPWLPFTRYDEWLGPVQGRRRAVINSGQTPTLTATAKTTYEAIGDNSIISWQIEENWSNGTGSGGNPAYPTQVADIWDDNRGAVHQVLQLVVKASQTASLTVSGTTVTEINYEPFNEFLLRKKTETWEVPGPLIVERSYLLGDETKPIIVTRQLVKTNAYSAPNIGASGLTVDGTTSMTRIDAKLEAYKSDVVSWNIQVYQKLPGPLVTMRAELDEFGSEVTVTKQRVAASAASSLTNTAALQEIYEGLDSVQGDIIGTQYTVDGMGNPVFAMVTEVERVDERIPGSRATIYYYLVDAASTIPDDTSTIVYTRKRHPRNPNVRLEIKTVYAVPSNYTEVIDRAHAFPEIFILFSSVEPWGSYYNSRPGFSEIVPCTVQHAFSTGLVTPAPTTIREAEWHYWMGFNGRGLTNGENYTFNKDGASATLDLPTSTPSRATYESWIDSASLIIGGSCEIYRAGIYHVTEISTIAS